MEYPILVLQAPSLNIDLSKSLSHCLLKIAKFCQQCRLISKLIKLHVEYPNFTSISVSPNWLLGWFISIHSEGLQGNVSSCQFGQNLQMSCTLQTFMAGLQGYVCMQPCDCLVCMAAYSHSQIYAHSENMQPVFFYMINRLKYHSKLAIEYPVSLFIKLLK